MQQAPRPQDGINKFDHGAGMHRSTVLPDDAPNVVNDGGASGVHPLRSINN